jgi:hypothetical protein
MGNVQGKAAGNQNSQKMHEGTSAASPVSRSPKEAAVSNQWSADYLSHAPEDAKAAAESNQFSPGSKVNQDNFD